MSDPLYIALVAEGLTDGVVIRSALQASLEGRSYVLKQLKPEQSLAFASQPNFGPDGGGWGGVYKWCRQAQERAGGKLSDDEVLLSYDVLIIHLDADVAGKRYEDIGQVGHDLPCEQPCPPPSASTDPLRQVLLGWAGETAVPSRTVLCTPSKSMEAWVLRALEPQEKELINKGWECHPAPETRLATLPKQRRFKKSEEDYRKRQDEIAAAWPQVVSALSEAQRFASELRGAIPP